MGSFEVEKGPPGSDEIQDPHFESEVWVGISRALLAFGGFCPTQLPALGGTSASFGLTFPTGEVGTVGEAGSQLCLTAGQLPVSCAVSRRARRLLPSTGSSVTFGKKIHTHHHPPNSPSHTNLFIGFMFRLFLF